jgi:hypothetical protein
MEIMLNKIKYCAILVAIILFSSSCQKDYLDKVPLSGPSSSSFYSNEAELKLGLVGCYKSINFNINGEPRTWISILDMTSDIGWNRSSSDVQQMGNGSLTSQTASIKQLFTGFYDGIGRCNFLLDNIDNLKDKISPAVYSATKAEARFIRAMNYHYLSELFGGVPLVTKTLKLEELQVAKSTKAQVVDFVISEMEEASKDLPNTYGTADTQHGRATKSAALAIKARAALYNGKYDVAAAAAKAVMDLKQYKLDTSFPKLFNYDGQASPEIILSLQFLKGVITQSIPNFYGSRLAGGVSNEVPAQSMVDSYECTDGLTIDKSPLFSPLQPFKNRDPRLGYTIVLPGSTYFDVQFETHPDSLKVWNYAVTPATRINNTDATNAFATFTGYLWRKYTDIRDKADDTHSDMNIILIRYAEVLLNYAEAKIEANQIDQSVYDAINEVRQRPGVNMPAITIGKTQVELRSIIRRERKCELAVEGLRLFDIRRWKIAEQVMKGPFLGRIKTSFLSSAPAIDANGTADYSNVANRSQMRLIENRNFNPARDYVWPFPNVEVLTNKSLIQNPNW